MHETSSGENESVGQVVTPWFGTTQQKPETTTGKPATDNSSQLASEQQVMIAPKGNGLVTSVVERFWQMRAVRERHDNTVAALATQRAQGYAPPACRPSKAQG